MKIVIDGRFYGIEHTGIGRYTINLIHYLKDVDKENEYVVILRKKYFNTLKFPENWEKEMFDIRHYTVREQIGLLPILWKHKPDVFHSLQLNVPYFYFGKQVVTIHDTTQLSSDTRATTLSLPLYYMKLLAIQVSFQKALMASRIVVPTNVVKQDLVVRGANKDKIHVIHEGFDDSLTSKTPQSNLLKKYGLFENYFLYVGNAYPHKNLKRAINAVKEVNANRKNLIDFAIVCSRSEFTKDLKDYISETNTSDYVKFLGHVSDDDLHSLYNYSQALFYPSMKEGFGLPGLEAMAAGTIVVSSDIPVFEEVFGDAALYFDPTNVQEMKKTLEKVLSLSSSERKKQIQKGKAKVKEYSWQKMAENTLKVYKSIL